MKGVVQLVAKTINEAPPRRLPPLLRNTIAAATAPSLPPSLLREQPGEGPAAPQPPSPQPTAHHHPPSPTRWLRIVLLLTLTLASAACRDQNPSPPTNRQRIVTLAPAITQMVVDLGLTDALVGIAENDMAAPPALPVVGTFTDIDTERLIALQPTHVLMTVGKEGISPRLHALAAAGNFELLAYPYPRTINDIAATVYDPHNPDSVGRALNLPARAKTLRQNLLDSLNALRSRTAGLPAPRVLIVIGLHPLMASGPGTVHDQLLAYVGGTNAAAHATVTAPTYDRETLLALDPQVILILSPGAPDGLDPATLLPELVGLPIQAVRDNRITILSDPLVMLPSTSLPRIAAQMANAIHPDLPAPTQHAPAPLTPRQEAGANGR